MINNKNLAQLLNFILNTDLLLHFVTWIESCVIGNHITSTYIQLTD